MGLLDELQQEQEGKRAGGISCRMCALTSPGTSPLSAEDANDLATALGSRGIFASTIINVLEKRGQTVTAAQVGAHRRAHVPGWAS